MEVVTKDKKYKKYKKYIKIFIEKSKDMYLRKSTLLDGVVVYEANSSQGLYGGTSVEHFSSTSLHTSCHDLYHSPGTMWANLSGDVRSSRSKSNMSFWGDGEGEAGGR